MKQLEVRKCAIGLKFRSPKVKSMMAHYPDVFIMTFSIHIPNFVLLSQSAQLLLNFCYAAAQGHDREKGDREEGCTKLRLLITIRREQTLVTRPRY